MQWLGKWNDSRRYRFGRKSWRLPGKCENTFEWVESLSLYELKISILIHLLSAYIVAIYNSGEIRVKYVQYPEYEYLKHETRYI